jgi:hypothetical protein
LNPGLPTPKSRTANRRRNKQSPQPIREMQNMVSKLVGPKHGKVLEE